MEEQSGQSMTHSGQIYEYTKLSMLILAYQYILIYQTLIKHPELRERTRNTNFTLEDTEEVAVLETA